MKYCFSFWTSDTIFPQGWNVNMAFGLKHCRATASQQECWQPTSLPENPSSPETSLLALLKAAFAVAPVESRRDVAL